MWQSIQRNMTWRAVPVAGIIAGTVHMLTNLILTPLLYDVEPDIVPRYWASLLLGDSVLTGNDMGTVAVGIVVHYALSLVFALVIAVVIHRWGLIVGIVGGAILGLSLYAINFYTMTVIFDWYFAVNGEVMLLAHVLFGATAGGVYETFDHYDVPFDLEVNDARG